MLTYESLLEVWPDATDGDHICDVQDCIDGSAEVGHAIVGDPESFVVVHHPPSWYYRQRAWLRERWGLVRLRIYERSPSG